MRPLFVVVRYELAHDVVHVLLVEDHEVIYTRLLQRLEESLDESIGTG